MRLIDIEPFETQKEATSCKILVNLSGENCAASYVLSTSDISTVDAVPAVHGKWLDRPKNEGWEDEDITVIGMVNGEPWASCYCSECGEWLVASDEYSVKGNYCPNCGAKMEG